MSTCPTNQLVQLHLVKKVIGIFAGFGILLVLASPVLLVAPLASSAASAGQTQIFSNIYNLLYHFSKQLTYGFNFIKLACEIVFWKEPGNVKPFSENLI